LDLVFSLAQNLSVFSLPHAIVVRRGKLLRRFPAITRLHLRSGGSSNRTIWIDSRR
jgi:hypothetical protein